MAYMQLHDPATTPTCALQEQGRRLLLLLLCRTTHNGRPALMTPLAPETHIHTVRHCTAMQGKADCITCWVAQPQNLLKCTCAESNPKHHGHSQRKPLGATGRAAAYTLLLRKLLKVAGLAVSIMMAAEVASGSSSY